MERKIFIFYNERFEKFFLSFEAFQPKFVFQDGKILKDMWKYSRFSIANMIQRKREKI